MPSTRFWLAVGTRQNWHTAFDYGGMWGLKATQRHYWERLTENTDVVFFYSTLPVGGVVGYGLIRTKLQQRSPLWHDELIRNEIIWPLRFEFDVLSCLAPNQWENQRVVLPELKARVRGGFQALEGALAEEIMRALPEAIPENLALTAPVGLRAKLPLVGRESSVLPADPHDRTQALLVEIGRLQRYLADSEYPLENRRVDVVWRRVQRSVPSYVFEVQVAGNITEALGKLKRAFDLWNSNIFLVGKQEHRAPFNELVQGTFHEVQNRLQFIELNQVEELHQRKRAYREFEGELGILA